MNHNIIFQKIETDDLPEVSAIEQQCYPNPWPQKTMQDCLDADYQCLKGLSEQSPDILCYAFMAIGHEEAHLLKITVHPEHQKKGLAQAMLQRLTLICRINHARRIWLEVRAGNEPAIRFYQKAGFETKGLRRNYYRYQDQQGKKVKEDALVMCFSLLN
ncbi:ribosomal protein S18-alanine N-acetyltransferase [Marinicella gelatinilytica]|uniref:ribosomal protein S18-alanine N-acetyltransferase n=1 Tax=Marinicella gelatinilytica TaxID=2996017 RepID=UPI002260B5D2|nr:ribosomal protein S18-alanine N-acetyltransferase [Marinicella gelatinilytica]MCX7544207.1 ribosomal protein S18-alanine N-acetyltransferase [Marinicella gelatinilytica]